MTKKMSALISIIVPVYKVKEYIDECVQSIVNQSYKNLEIILVDDGSPDECPAVCDSWALKDSRIKVIHKINGGLSDARNAGLDVANGDYIAFVDSDDYIDPRMIQVLYEGIVLHKTDIEACKIYSLRNGCVTEYDCNGNKIKDAKSVISSKDYLRYYIGGQMENASWNKLYKRDCFASVRFRKGRNNEDFLMFYEMCKRISTIGFVDYFGYYYRQREGSIVHNAESMLFFDIIKNIEEIREDICANMPELKTEIERKEIQERIIFVKNVIKKRKSRENRKELKRNLSIIKEKPFSFVDELAPQYRKPFYILKLFPWLYFLQACLKKS